MSGVTRAKRTKGRLALVIVALMIVVAAACAAVWYFVIREEPVAPGPARPSFAAAAVVSDGRISGQTADGGTDAEAVAAGALSQAERAVWFRWTPINGGWAYVTAAQAGGALPPVRAFVGTELSSLTRVDVSTEGMSGGAAIPAVAGTTYTLAVVVGGTNFNAADFDLVVNQPLSAGPTHDHLNSALGVGGTVEKASVEGVAQIVAVDTLDRSTAQPEEPDHGGVAAAHSVWFTWTATDSGEVIFKADPTYGGVGPFRVAVYSFQEPAGSPDSQPGYTFSKLTPVGADGSFAAAKGVEYFIAVDGPEEFYTLSVTASGIASSIDSTPPEVTCAPAPTEWAVGEFAEVSCTAMDSGSGLAQPADANFLLTAPTVDGIEDDQLATGSRAVCDLAGNCTTAGPIDGLRADRKAPVVTCMPLPVTWQPAAASVVCTAVDGGSGLARDTDATREFRVDALVGTEGPVTVLGGEICDAAGNCTEVGPFGEALIDNVPPTISCATPPSGPQSAEVVVVCTAADSGSGLVVPTDAEFTLRTSVGAGNSSKTATTDSKQICDLAGNCVEAGPVGPFEIDLAPPSVVCEPDDGSAIDDWRANPLTVNCAVADLGLGLADGSKAQFTLTATVAVGEESDTAVAADGPGTVTQVCDKAGSCVEIGTLTGIKIDRKAPMVTCPEPAGDWTGTSATVTCSVVDGGSGLSGPGTVTLTATQTDGQAGEVSTDTAQVCDMVGNCAVAGPVRGLLVDAAPPTVTCATPAPLYRVEARISCVATDQGSGLADPDDATFLLVTVVGDGNVNTKAQTSSRQVCDVAGLCTEVGPITVNVDRSGQPGAGPTIEVPTKLTVLTVGDSADPVAVWYQLPTAEGADSVECRSRPGSAFAYGWSTVICEAIAPLGVSYASFPVVVKSLPELASAGQATPGGPWRAVGIGFAAASDVQVEIGTTVVATVQADGKGRVAAAFDIPADLPTGDHQLVLRGVDEASAPHLVVASLTAVAAAPGEAPPTQMPSGAPELPNNVPTVPADPGSAPIPPALDEGAWPDVSGDNTAVTPTAPTPDQAGAEAASAEGGFWDRFKFVIIGAGLALALLAGWLVMKRRRRA